MNHISLKEATTHWLSIAKILSVPRSEEEYQQLVELLDQLIDEVGENEEHHLASLMETLGLIIAAYEEAHLPTFNSPSGVESLKFLMEEHGLTSSDLPEVGSQGVVSEILNGKHQLNARQLRALSERFKVSPTIFF